MDAPECGDGRAGVMRRGHRIDMRLPQAHRKFTLLLSNFQASPLAALVATIDPAALIALAPVNREGCDITIANLSAPRRRLPNRRRAAELFDLSFKGGRYTIGASRFPDGSLAEIFVHPAKASCDLADAARDAAVTLSLALQFGAPAAAIRAAVTRESDGSPAGIVGAVLDLLATQGEAQ